MFSSGNFLNFPVDDDVSIGSPCDLVRGSLSSIYSSPNKSSFLQITHDLSLKNGSFLGHAQSYESVEMFPDDETTNDVYAKKPRDLCDGLHVILSVPDLCDVTFLVGTALKPIYGLKAVMSTRSRVLHSLFLKHHVFLEPSSPEKVKKVGCFPKLFNQKKRNDKAVKPHMVISLPEHDPISFGAFVTFLHTGSVNINVNGVVGIMHLAEIYKVDQLNKACWDFVDRCLNSQTAIAFLEASLKYRNLECVAHLTKTLLNFIDINALSVLPTNAFMHSSLAVASLVLSRPQLNLAENDRVAAILSWAKRHHRDSTSDLPSTLNRLFDGVDFSRVTSSNLKNDVIELGFVPPMTIEKSFLTSSRYFNAQGETIKAKKQTRKRDEISFESVLWSDSTSESGFSLSA